MLISNQFMPWLVVVISRSLRIKYKAFTVLTSSTIEGAVFCVVLGSFRYNDDDGYENAT